MESRAGAERTFAPLRIVSMGGGNGLSALLRGLKRYARLGPGAVEITAVVTVTDDGGSSGRLRREFDVLPPGDIRNCMVALSEDETLLSRLFQYRFASGNGLKGHSFGNLFLAAMSHLTGGFRAGREALIRGAGRGPGRIYPVHFLQHVVLEKLTLANGLEEVAGESLISRSTFGSHPAHSLNPRRVMPLPETLVAIAKADLITLGPGSLVHQRDSEPACGRHSAGHRRFPRSQGLLCEPDDPAGRDHAFPGLRPCRGAAKALRP